MKNQYIEPALFAKELLNLDTMTASKGSSDSEKAKAVDNLYINAAELDS